MESSTMPVDLFFDRLHRELYAALKEKKELPVVEVLKIAQVVLEGKAAVN